MKWLSSIFSFMWRDHTKYFIPNAAIKRTEAVLQEYGNHEDPHEGLVYWGGTIDNATIRVTAVFAPETDSSYGRVSTSYSTNSQYVTYLDNKRIIHIGQVHSHPGMSINHSEGDDQWTAFKSKGLISIVVPQFCKYGILPIQQCGVHRYENGQFIKLNSTYVKKHITITREPIDFMDVRK